MIREMNVHSMEEMGKDFYPNFLQPHLENVDRRICNDGSREPIPVFHIPPSAVARTLKYFVGVPSNSASSEREKKQVRITIQETREYLVCGSQVSLKLSPLQGMKAQPQRPLFVGEVTNASYQP